MLICLTLDGWPRSPLDHEPLETGLLSVLPCPRFPGTSCPRQALGKYLLSDLGGHGNRMLGPCITLGDLLTFVARTLAMLGQSPRPCLGLGAAPSLGSEDPRRWAG